MNSLQSVGESRRAALDAIADAAPDWLLLHLDPDWLDRDKHRFELRRLPKAESKPVQLREQVGQDVHRLLTLLDAGQTPQQIPALSQVALVRQVFLQHSELVGQSVHWRDGPAVQNTEGVVSPSDQQARSWRRRETVWLGYKAHLRETCDQDPQRAHLIVHVQTRPATRQDAEVLCTIEQQLGAKDLLADQQLVDQGSSSGIQLVKQAEQGTQIVGPVPADVSWHQRQQTGYGVQDFELDWQVRVATCPQGQQRCSWLSQDDRGKQPTEVIKFPAQICQACALREHGSHGKGGRSLSLNAQLVHQALLKRGDEQRTPAFLQRSNRGAGVEGTIWQAVRTTKLGRTPSGGGRKTHLRHVAIAAGLNLVGIAAHLQARAQNKPTRPGRSPSPFARLQQRSKAS